MKKSLFLITLLAASSIMFAEEYYESSDRELREGMMAKQQGARRGAGPYRKAQCYCSDLCGPRDVKPGDAPFYDPVTGQCFCQERDKRNYIPNQCDKKPNVEFESVCEQKTKRGVYTRGVYRR
jgi:hypothetical protein